MMRSKPCIGLSTSPDVVDCIHGPLTTSEARIDQRIREGGKVLVVVNGSFRGSSSESSGEHIPVAWPA
jgi:hypothetical protein